MAMVLSKVKHFWEIQHFATPKENTVPIKSIQPPGSSHVSLSYNIKSK